MTIQELQDRSYKTNEERGFHDGPVQLNIPSKLMLVVSELSEALEEHRNGKPLHYFSQSGADSIPKPEGIAAELADAVIRIADIAGILNFDLEFAISQKMDYNDTRPYMHGGRKY